MKLYPLVPARSARKTSPVLAGLARAWLLPLLALAGAWNSRAGMLPVANASFESPGTVFADPRIDVWQKSAQPSWYDREDPWELLSGVFLNPAPGSADHLENLDGAQAAFFFALPQVALHQVLSVPGSEPVVPVRYQVGRAYRLTVAVLGGGGGMTNGVTVDLSLQYQDGAGERLSVARTPVRHSAEAFPTNTRFVDYEVWVPTVRAGDPWAGQPIAVEVLSTVAPELAGGYWDFDHVRLEEVIEVPNGSFEGPATVFADPRIDVWQKSAQPPWYDDSQAPWAQLTGVFLNTAPGSPDHIENLHLNQGLFLFALPGVSVFQDAEVAPNTGLDVRVTAGRSYELRAAVLGGGGDMAEGSTLELRVYYRDPAGERVVLGATVVTNTAVAFPTRTRLEEYTVRTPAVRSGDASVGRPLGIECISTVSSDRVGGYWDVDEVRLAERREPFLTGARRGEGGVGFEFMIEGEIGARFEVLASGSLAEPVAGWTSLGTVVNTSGRVGFVDAAPGLSVRFYQVRQVP